MITSIETPTVFRCASNSFGILEKTNSTEFRTALGYPAACIQICALFLAKKRGAGGSLVVRGPGFGTLTAVAPVRFPAREPTKKKKGADQRWGTRTPRSPWPLHTRRWRVHVRLPLHRKTNRRLLAGCSPRGHLLSRVEVTAQTRTVRNEGQRVMDMAKEKAWHPTGDAGSWTGSWWCEDWLLGTLKSVWRPREPSEMHPFSGTPFEAWGRG